MKNFWRLFAAWVIELRDDPFANARFRLTLLYTFSILAVFAITAVLFNYFEISFSTFQTWVYLIIATGLTSYFVSHPALVPIRHIIRAQKRFIADASHELRTPLAIMKTNSEVALLNGKELTHQDATTTLQSNLEEIDRMSNLIENLLRLSHYDNRFVEIPFAPINLSRLVLEITEKMQTLTLKKYINLQLVNADQGIIMGNATALEQLTINLIKNAITYTPHYGQIYVSVNIKNTNELELKVKDNGIGIAEKDLPFVFGPFYKASHSLKSTEKGSSGLGLTIVRKIVERHKAWIYLNSKKGKGTTIAVTFPCIPPPQDGLR